MKRTYISPKADTSWLSLDQLIAASAGCVSPSLEEDDYIRKILSVSGVLDLYGLETLHQEFSQR